MIWEYVNDPIKTHAGDIGSLCRKTNQSGKQEPFYPRLSMVIGVDSVLGGSRGLWLISKAGKQTVSIWSYVQQGTGAHIIAGMLENIRL